MNTHLAILVVGIAVVPVAAQPEMITFDDIGAPVEIGDSYLSRGITFGKGNDQFGRSTTVTGSAWTFPCCGISAPSVMVPEPGSNADIWVFFYDLQHRRTVASFISVQNDLDNNPSSLVLEAFDKDGNLLGRTVRNGVGALAELGMDGIWYAKIYGVEGTGTGLGVDNVSFILTRPCPPDFNGDGFVTSQDLFDFLTAFLDLTPESDFNRDDLLNSQDLFDFIAAFFAGC